MNIEDLLVKYKELIAFWLENGFILSFEDDTLLSGVDDSSSVRKLIRLVHHDAVQAVHLPAYLFEKQ